MHRAKWVPGTLVRTFLIKYIYHEMPQTLTCISKSLFLMTQEVTFLGVLSTSTAKKGLNFIFCFPVLPP